MQDLFKVFDLYIIFIVYNTLIGFHHWEDYFNPNFKAKTANEKQVQDLHLEDCHINHMTYAQFIISNNCCWAQSFYAQGNNYILP